MENICCRYMIVENYLDNEIIVKVTEGWSYDGIEEALVSCPQFSSISALGHKKNRLTVSDVHNVIFKQLLSAEKLICIQKKVQFDASIARRHFHVISEYAGQKIDIPVTLRSGSDVAKVYCPSCAGVKTFKLEDNAYRDAIADEIGYCKRMIDKGYVFSKMGIFDKAKRKIKKKFY